MSNAIEQIVNAYVRLGNRRAIEDILTQRRKLAVDLKMRSGYDFSLPIGVIDEEIAVVEAGLDRLNANHSTERDGTKEPSAGSEVSGMAVTGLPANKFAR